MKDFETDNIFLASVVFGLIQKTHLAIANDKIEIKELVEEIYYKPQIQYIISYNELKEIYNLMTSSENFCLVVELIKEPNIDRLEHHFEINQKLTLLKDKYTGRDCIFITEDMMVQILKLFKEEMINSKNIPLISKSFKV